MSNIFGNYLLPLLLILLAILDAALQVGFFYKPHITFSLIFFCSLFPSLQPNLIALTIIGLIEDALQMQIFGLTSILYVIFSVLVTSNRHAFLKQKFMMVWIGFTLLFAAINLLEVLCYYTFTNMEISWGSIIKNFLLTITLYPFLHYNTMRILKVSNTQLTMNNA